MSEPLDNILSGAKEAPAQEQVEKQVQVETPEPEANQQTMVPHEALHAEKQKVKRYTEQVASFEKQLADRDALWDRRFTQFQQSLERLVPQQQEPVIDWYSDPDGAIGQRLDRVLTPLDGKFRKLETEMMRLSAMQQYGADKVQAFEKYAGEAIGRGDPEMIALSAQMRASPDPMATGLKWFEQRTFDPAAERERLKAELLAEMGQQPQQNGQPVMPSNLATARNVGSRAGPAWAGPKPLSDIFARN